MLGQGCSILNATSLKSSCLTKIIEHLQRAELWECRVGFFQVSPPRASKSALIGGGGTGHRQIEGLLFQQARCPKEARPREVGMKELLILTRIGQAAGGGRCQKVCLPPPPRSLLQGWVFRKKFVLKNYEAPAFSRPQRRKAQLCALSFPPLGTF